MKYLLIFALCVSQPVFAEPREINEYRWTGVERIVAIGDIHGDYENYMATLQAAELVNSRGKWTGGETHLVQTGDIPDRGPDTMKIIEHMRKLAKEARKKGGRVHNLMGNHDAMNVYGDLRYVSGGEYEAFATRNSESLRERYFAAVMADLESRDPEKFASLPEDFRVQWDKEHPLGWVEHRQAWDPAWNPDGEFVKWAMDIKVAIQLNDMIFLHGGISGFYCQNSLESLTEMAHQALNPYDLRDLGILEDEFGPLWYRGLSGVAPEASMETVEAILQHHEAEHIIVGHTPTSGVVWPGYGGRVVQIDTGIGAAYGGHVAYLESTAAGLFAGYPEGKFALPGSTPVADMASFQSEQVAYLQQVIAQDSDNRHLQKRLADLTATPAPVATAAPAKDAATDAVESESAEPAKPVPTCGISQ